MALTPQDLLEMLDKMGIKTTTHQHEALFTVEQSSKLYPNMEGGHTKNLFVKDKKNNFFLLVLESCAEIDLNRLHRVIGAKSRLSFGKPERLMEYLGVKPGSVTAFSVVNDVNNNVKLIIDKSLFAHDKINCHPLTNEMTTTISKSDLIRFLSSVNHEPEIIAISGLANPEQ